MSHEVLAKWFAAPAVESLEIRICKAPVNHHGWVFVWAVVEYMLPLPGTSEVKEKILAGTGKNGEPGSLTLDDAMASAARAYESLSLIVQQKQGAA